MLSKLELEIERKKLDRASNIKLAEKILVLVVKGKVSMNDTVSSLIDKLKS